MYYEVEVPHGVLAGQGFQANIGGALMLVTCPEGAGQGSIIQVQGPGAAPPVTGVPVDAAGAAAGEFAATGLPVPSTHSMGRVYASSGQHMMLPQEGFVEVEEISPAGWMCLIIGCFTCPGFNLLGLCMRERRLVPVSVL